MATGTPNSTRTIIGVKLREQLCEKQGPYRPQRLPPAAIFRPLDWPNAGAEALAVHGLAEAEPPPERIYLYCTNTYCII